MASDFSSLYASLSVYTSCWKLCGQCWLFAESQSSSKATDKATAGGWVAGWRIEGDDWGEVTEGSMPLFITVLDPEEKTD